jgi:hypothetical protein
VSLARLKPALIVGAALLALSASSAAAVAIVEFQDIRIKADGSFQPRELPHKKFAPIEFQGFIDISSRSGQRPATLQRAVVDFDRDGKLDADGLPTCAPEKVAAASTEEARDICRGAIVGTGKVEALVYLDSGVVPTSAPLTIFNGPPSNGNPTVVLHARTTTPATQTYAILVPIERHRGYFRYRATLDLPPIAGGLGVLTRIKVNVGRRFKVDGQPRSYVSAHCSDGILQTQARLDFGGNAIVEGAVEKFCRVK